MVRGLPRLSTSSSARGPRHCPTGECANQQLTAICACDRIDPTYPRPTVRRSPLKDAPALRTRIVGSMAALIPTRCVTPRIFVPQSAPFRRRQVGRPNGFVTAETHTIGPMAVGWCCSSCPGRYVRQALEPCSARRSDLSYTSDSGACRSFWPHFRARHRCDPRPKDVVRKPFEERVNRCPFRPPGRVDEISLRIVRRGEGAAIDENGFSLHRRLRARGIRSEVGA